MKIFKKTTLTYTLASLLTLAAIGAGMFFNPVQRAHAAASDNQIMFILDASSSMLYSDNTSSTRIDKAKAALTKTIEATPSSAKVGVRVYGSTVPETNQQAGCKDSVLLSSPKANNAKNLRSAISNVQAKGWTLIGKALQDVKGDFSGEGAKTVILLSDGIDTCNPSKVCEIAKSLRSASIKVHTVGIVVTKAARQQLQCVAKNTGGTYYDVNNIGRLQKALQALTSRETAPEPEKKGTPIRGTEDVNDAPIMLSDTLYADTLNVRSPLYYGFDALPEQKIKFTITAKDTDSQLDWFNYLTLQSYSKLDGSSLAAKAIFGTNTRFEEGADTVSLSFTVDTKEQGIKEAQPIAVKLGVSGTRDESSIKVPIQIKVTTEGGIAPDNKNIDSENQKTAVTPPSSDSSPNGSSWLLPALLLVALAIIATAVAILLSRRHKKGLVDTTETTDHP